MKTKKSLRVMVLALAVVMVFGVCSTALATTTPAGLGYKQWGSSSNWPTLKSLSNSESNYIVLVQNYMNYRFYYSQGSFPQLSEDGRYGENTKQRVRDFQYQSGIQSDGQVGPNTWGKMFQATYLVNTVAGRRHFGARIYNGALTSSCVGNNASANISNGMAQPYWYDAFLNSTG